MRGIEPLRHTSHSSYHKKGSGEIELNFEPTSFEGVFPHQLPREVGQDVPICGLFAGRSLYEEGAYQPRIDTHEPSAH